MNAYPVLLAMCSAFIGSLGQIEFTRGSKLLEFSIQGLVTNYHILFGLTLYAFATVLYLIALKNGQLSLIYPIIATSYIWVLLFARYYFNEPVTLVNAAGIMLIVLGISLVSLR